MSLGSKNSLNNPFLSNNPNFILSLNLFNGGEFIDKIEQTLTDLQHGKFILVYDSDNREGETDFVIPAQFANPSSIKQMRKDGGGLIFLMTSHQIANKLQLPFLADLYTSIQEQYPLLKVVAPDDIPYDTKSSFSLCINHRNTYTGITDIDRSLTMNQFAQIIAKLDGMDTKQAMTMFGKEFRSPGHIPICIASEHLLNERRGHTELIVSLLHMAHLIPAGAGCEMMGNSGKALSKEDAQAYAAKHHFTFLEGHEIIRAWNKWSP